MDFNITGVCVRTDAHVEDTHLEVGHFFLRNQFRHVIDQMKTKRIFRVDFLQKPTETTSTKQNLETVIKIWFAMNDNK